MMGINTSSLKSVVIVVLSVNQPPSFDLPDKSVSIAVRRSQAPLSQMLPGFATSISAGSLQEDTYQRITFTVTGIAGSLIFTRPPRVSKDGTLAFTLAQGSGASMLLNSFCCSLACSVSVLI
jgi:hypothetical protein